MTVTVEKRIEVFGGKEVEVTITRHVGRAVYESRRGPIEADECIERDYGPKGGVARSYIHYPDISPEENERRTKELQALAGRLAVNG